MARTVFERAFQVKGRVGVCPKFHGKDVKTEYFIYSFGILATDMSLPKAYNAKDYEKDIYQLWEKSGVFTPKKAAHQDSYSIMMPLPNANGRLHIGSVLFVTLQDIAARYQRMQGKATLWLPGADHAGFETWVVYEKQLAKEGKSRFDFTREELYKQVWDFVAAFRKTFENQFRELGASVDWTRFTFSLDEKIVRQVYATFKKMWDEGLIYRGVRVVNYCTFHGTSFADIEVEYKDVESKLWQIAYPLTDGGGEVIVATTRPETMLGDVAVAVNPADERYKGFIGKTVKLPLTNREIPVIADDFVDMEFGTGAVKITPAHDPIDFEVAQRHDLPMISVIDHEGNMTHKAPEPYRGLRYQDARKKVVEDLEKAGFLKKVEDYTHSVGHCYKCGNVIQPLLRDQWFVDMKPLAARAIETLKAKKIDFYPDSKRTQLIKYLEGLKDWNISRQIAWGIPIPAFQNVEDSDDWIYDERVGEETIQVGKKTYRCDPDVFDTWFSSSQWPFATLGIGSEDFKQFYPTSLMETGGEILYPWVSRMIMLGLYMTGEIPFKDVYIHGYVLATDGAKMSKSLGNVVDPDDLRIKYGADALRLGIIDGRAAAINRPFDETKAVAGRNFANKLWNVARYVESVKGKNNSVKSIADHWILNMLSISTGLIEKQLNHFNFSEAYNTLYHFVWDDFADWYIEASKLENNGPDGQSGGRPERRPEVLNYVLESTLKIAHPFAPFVSETIWQSLQGPSLKGKGLLASELWPEKVEFDAKKSKEFENLKAVVEEIRRISAAVEAVKPCLQYDNSPLIETNAKLITMLARLGAVEKAPQDAKSLPAGRQGLRLSSSQNIWLDIDPAKYLDKLKTSQKAREAAIKLLEGRLANKSYVDNAPAELVEETKQQLEEENRALDALNQEISSLEKST